MAFNYDLNSADAAIKKISTVRFEIGDTVDGTGILPTGGNLSDEEIQTVLDAQSGDVSLSVAALCTVLARRWSNEADTKSGPFSDSLSDIAKAWAERATEAESQAITSGSASSSFVATIGKSDGYTGQ